MSQKVDFTKTIEEKGVLKNAKLKWRKKMRSKYGSDWTKRKASKKLNGVSQQN